MKFGEHNEEIFDHAAAVGIQKEDALADTYNETAERQSEYLIQFDQLSQKIKNLRQRKEMEELIDATDTPEYELIINRISALEEKLKDVDREADELQEKLTKIFNFKEVKDTKENLGIDSDISEN